MNSKEWLSEHTVSAPIPMRSSAVQQNNGQVFSPTSGSQLASQMIDNLLASSPSTPGNKFVKPPNVDHKKDSADNENRQSNAHTPVAIANEAQQVGATNTMPTSKIPYQAAQPVPVPNSNGWAGPPGLSQTNGHSQWTFGTSPIANTLLVASPDTGMISSTIHALMQQSNNLRMVSPGGNAPSQPLTIVGSGIGDFYQQSPPQSNATPIPYGTPTFYSMGGLASNPATDLVGALSNINIKPNTPYFSRMESSSVSSLPGSTPANNSFYSTFGDTPMSNAPASSNGMHQARLLNLSNNNAATQPAGLDPQQYQYLMQNLQLLQAFSTNPSQPPTPANYQAQQQYHQPPQQQQQIPFYQPQQPHPPQSNSAFALQQALQQSSYNPVLPSNEMMRVGNNDPALAALSNPLTNGNNGTRSKLLEEFRQSNGTQLQSLRDLKDHVVEFAQDQHGSRFIQSKLEKATLAEKNLVYDEVLPNVQHLMTDVFGNYVIQKFFEYGTHEQKVGLVDSIEHHVLPMSMQMYGCRVIQKALENVPPDQQIKIITELQGHVLKCVKDQNGNHVIQKIIEKVESNRLYFILDAICKPSKPTEKNKVYDMSTHPYGCRVIQRILENCTDEQTEPILGEIHATIKSLVTDQYGNYVVQHVLEHGKMDDKARIIQAMLGNVLHYSQHKYASNVIEKCLREGTNDQRTAFVREVIADDSMQTLSKMMKDQFANYVIQRMFDVADERSKCDMIYAIKPHIPTLKRYNYGKHIMTKLEKYLTKRGMATDLNFDTNSPPPPSNVSSVSMYSTAPTPSLYQTPTSTGPPTGYPPPTPPHFTMMPPNMPPQYHHPALVPPPHHMQAMPPQRPPHHY